VDFSVGLDGSGESGPGRTQTVAISTHRIASSDCCSEVSIMPVSLLHCDNLATKYIFVTVSSAYIISLY